MIRHLIMLGVLLVAVPSFSTLQACPVCNEETGKQVRAGLFDRSFGPNLLATMLPFAVFLGVVAAIHWGGPRPHNPTESANGDPIDHARSPGAFS